VIEKADLIALMPLLAVSAGAVVLMLLIAVRRSHALSASFAAALFAAACASLWPAAGAAPRQVGALLVVDSYALLYMGMIFASAFVVVILSYGYFEDREGSADELYVLLLLASCGAAVLAASSHFASFFLGLEILTVPLYAMIAYLPRRALPLEAGIKYLVLAAASAAFLLFGMALIYARLGVLEFARIAALIDAGAAADSLVLTGLVLIVTGFGFKLALAPFHLWTPDVYEGAPAPVTAFIATVSKAAMFALLMRYFPRLGANDSPQLAAVFSAIAIASMLAGNLLALLQTNVKRILAYSSIAHMGYVLVAFRAGGDFAAGAVAFYLAAYSVTSLGAFGVVTVLSTAGRDADSIADYRGLFWKRPLLGGVFSAMLFSLAGIPLTAGFVAKFYVVAAGASSSIWMLLIVLVVSSVIGLYYYLRIIVALYSDMPAPGAARAEFPSLSAANGLVLAALAVLLLWFGIHPGPLMNVIRDSVAGMR
jgi:NADH-quinone oxidoreductase subunit N